MIGVFIYGELVAKRNFQLIIDTPVRCRVESACLLEHQLVVNADDVYGARQSLLSTINGLLYYLDEAQVHTLINYYGRNFRLSTGVAKVGGIERQVKFMLETSGVSYVGACNKEGVERRLLSASALYAENENERKYIQSTVQYLFPNRTVEWIASNYPYYVKWVRNVGYDSNYMLPMVQGIEVDKESIAAALVPVFPEVSRGNIQSIVVHNRVTEPIDLEQANVIAKYAYVLGNEVTSVQHGLSDADINVPGELETLTLDEPYEALSKLSEISGTIPNMREKIMFLLISLRLLDLPLVDLSDLEGQQVNAYIMNNLYINNLLED